MKISLYILATVITLTILNSCSEKVVYLEPHCPTLETFGVDKANPIHYEVVSGDIYGK